MQNLNFGLKETPVKINPLFTPENNSPNSFNFIPPSKEENKPKNEILGKKIQSDADLISWLSGKDLDSKKNDERCVPEELNSKIKKKLKNKLIKNAQKCELYFVRNLSNNKYINISCIYCLKNIFDHNELLQFVNFEELVYYLKYIFYLSDKVFSYSVQNFKNNKKESDNLFSRFKSNEEYWNFIGNKYICKLCIFKLVNKPNLIENMKNIFLKGKTEISSDTKTNIYVIINTDENEENKIYKNENKIKKNNNNLKKLNFKKNDEIDNPKKINIYNSNNININIENAKIINNNYNINNNINNNINQSGQCYQRFKDLEEKLKKNQTLNPIELENYWQFYFYIIHNKIIDLCREIKEEIFQLSIFINNISYFQNSGEKLGDNNKLIIKTSQNKSLFLFKLLEDSIIVINTCLNAYKNDYRFIKNNKSQILDQLMIKNENSYNLICSILFIYNNAVNSYLLS